VDGINLVSGILPEKQSSSGLIGDLLEPSARGGVILSLLKRQNGVLTRSREGAKGNGARKNLESEI
jgi:hypothetical protein